MSGVTWFGVAFVYSLLLSWVALRRRDWLSIPWIKPLGLVGFLALSWFMLQGFRSGSQDAYGTAFFIGGAFGVLSICFAPYVVYLVGETFDRLHRSAAGIDSMRVEKSYDHAEKHESEGNWKAALGLYSDEARRDPKDAEVRRRAGEAARKLGQREESIRWFREAVRTTRGKEPRVILSFRLSELLLEEPATREEAVGLLEEIRVNHEGTNFEKFAQERLSRIQERT